MYLFHDDNVNFEDRNDKDNDDNDDGVVDDSGDNNADFSIFKRLLSHLPTNEAIRFDQYRLFLVHYVYLWIQ